MNNKIDKTSNFVDQVISKIDIPKPEIVNLPTNYVNIQENFESDNNFDWFSSDLFRVIIIIILLYLLIFNNCNKKKE